MSNLRIVMLGNHTVGVRTLESLHACGEVVGVVCHPTDPEDGVRYESLFDASGRLGVTNVIRATPRDETLTRFVAAARPDLLWTTDYRYVLPMPLVQLARLGGVNLHPSLLPKYRGRASINWAILNGEHQLGLTAHLLAEGADTGDIVGQVAFELFDHEDVGDALSKLYPLYQQLTTRVITMLATGSLKRMPQDEARATAFPRRKPEDGAIDWSLGAKQIHNLIRAVSRPYPGAFTELRGERVYVWKSRVAKAQAVGSPGEVVWSDGSRRWVQTGDGILHIEEATYENGNPVDIRAGMRFEVIAIRAV